MKGVLVLDATYTPEKIISTQAAVTLLLSGKAVPVSDEHVTVLRSQRLAVKIPAVIQLAVVAKWMYRYKEPMCTHKGVLARDQYICQFVVCDSPCSAPGTTVDHVIPKSQGGQNTWENLIASCPAHNHFKTDRSMQEMASKFDWSLRRTPEPPKRSLRLLERAGVESAHPAWVPFLV